MERKLNILVAVAIVQAVSLLAITLGTLTDTPRSAHAGDAQNVFVTGHRITRYEPVPVQIRNDDAIKVRCVD